MFMQRFEALNIQIQPSRPPSSSSTRTNWNNVQSELFNILANKQQPNNDRFRQRQNIMKKLASEWTIPSDEESFAMNNSDILSSTRVSTPKDGSFRRPMPPRISVIPRRTPLRQNGSLMNISTNAQAANKRKSDMEIETKSAKKIKASNNSKKFTPRIVPRSTPIAPVVNPLGYYQTLDFDSPYNSPYTPNTIRNLDIQKSMYTSRMFGDQSAFRTMASVMTQTRVDDDDVSMKNVTVQTHSPGMHGDLKDTPIQEIGRKNSSFNNDDLIQQEPMTLDFDGTSLSAATQSTLKTTILKKRQDSFVEKKSKNSPKNFTKLKEKEHTKNPENNYTNNATELVEYSTTLNETTKHSLSKSNKDCNESDQLNLGNSQVFEDENAENISQNEESICSKKDVSSTSVNKITDRILGNTKVVDYDSSDDDDDNESDNKSNSEGNSDNEDENPTSTANISEESVQQGNEHHSSIDLKKHDNNSVRVSRSYSKSPIIQNCSLKTVDGNNSKNVNSSINFSSKSNQEISTTFTRNRGQNFNKSISMLNLNENSGKKFNNNATALVNYSSSFDEQSGHVPNNFDDHNSDFSENEIEEEQDAIHPSFDNESSDENEENVSLQQSHHYEDSEEEIDDHINQPDSDFNDSDNDHDDGLSSNHSLSQNSFSSDVQHQLNNDSSDDEIVHRRRPRSLSSDDSGDESSTEQIIIRRKKHANSSMKKRIYKAVIGNDTEEIIRPHDSSRTRYCRRSKRNRVKPLDYWSGQRPIYKTEKVNGNNVCTLVGVSAICVEPVRKFARKTGARKAKPLTTTIELAQPEIREQKMENILNLSIHNKKFKELPETDQIENIIPFDNIKWNESKTSPGVYTTITKKVKEGDIAFGKLKFDPKAEKTKTKTGLYVTYFNVVYGSLMLKVETKSDTLIKTGCHFEIEENTQYSIFNLRNDHALIDFIIKKKID